MRALTVIPGQAQSAALSHMPEPAAEAGDVLVEVRAVGVCGTDAEIVAGEYGWAPPGERRLILGHESIGVVLEAPGEGSLNPGDWVVGIVRRPDPVPCRHCGAGEWDMCDNGRYAEHGIKELHGFAAERVRLPAERAVKVDAGLGELAVLLEPASIVAKAWEHIDRIGARALYEPRRVLVTGAGPIGLLAALLGVQRGLEVHLYDRNERGAKPALARELGVVFHPAARLSESGAPPADVVIECTGAAPVVMDSMQLLAPNGILCLTGVPAPGKELPFDVGAWNRELVLGNRVIFGTVNANRRHYDLAAAALARADPSLLARFVTARVPLSRWSEALDGTKGHIKRIIAIQE